MTYWYDKPIGNRSKKIEIDPEYYEQIKGKTITIWAVKPSGFATCWFDNIEEAKAEIDELLANGYKVDIWDEQSNEFEWDNVPEFQGY